MGFCSGICSGCVGGGCGERIERRFADAERAQRAAMMRANGMRKRKKER